MVMSENFSEVTGWDESNVLHQKKHYNNNNNNIHILYIIYYLYNIYENKYRLHFI